MKPKRKRTVKNALVNIEDVSIQPGPHYINWIDICQEKLKEREMKILNQRLQITDKSINSSIRQFIIENTKTFQKHNNVHIYVDRMMKENYQAYNSVKDKNNNKFSTIVNNYNQAVTDQLSDWKGYRPQKLKSKIKTFKEYFKACRSWWDLRKIEIMAKEFLVPISNLINEVVQNAASEFFANRFFDLQQIYVTYLNTLLLVNLLESTLKLPNTRALFLIPEQTYARIAVEHVKITYSYNPINRKNSKAIRSAMLELLKKQYNDSKLEFETKLLSLHYEIDNFKSVNIPQYYLPSPQNTHNYNINMSQPITNYTNYHSSENKYKCSQYHPFNRVNVSNYCDICTQSSL